MHRALYIRSLTFRYSSSITLQRQLFRTMSTSEGLKPSTLTPESTVPEPSSPSTSRPPSSSGVATLTSATEGLTLHSKVAAATGVLPPEQKLIFAPDDAQYTVGKLERGDLNDDPFIQFHDWFKHAHIRKCHQPEATTLSTAHLPSGRVSARIVYLKELDHRGFVIYSNWDTSTKSRDIASNPQAALTFWFREVERQIRVEGVTERLSREESQVYFDTRIRGSRLGAWASRQSTVLSGREELEQRVKEVEKRFEGIDEIPVPDFWGGLRIVPTAIEFWQGRHSRLHDRFRYTRESPDDTEWKIERLSP